MGLLVGGWMLGHLADANQLDAANAPVHGWKVDEGRPPIWCGQKKRSVVPDGASRRPRLRSLGLLERDMVEDVSSLWEVDRRGLGGVNDDPPTGEPVLDSAGDLGGSGMATAPASFIWHDTTSNFFRLHPLSRPRRRPHMGRKGPGRSGPVPV